MKNDSVGEMVAELKSSPAKLSVVVIGLVLGIIGLLTTALQQEDPISISYSDLMAEIYLSDRTTAQEAKIKSKYEGERVAWSGDVVDVTETWLGYQVAVGTRGTLFTDIVLSGVSEPDALAYSTGDEIRFTGQIDRIKDTRITGTVYLTDVQVN